MFIEALEEKQIDFFYITFFIYTADVSKTKRYMSLK